MAWRPTARRSRRSCGITTARACRRASSASRSYSIPRPTRRSSCETRDRAPSRCHRHARAQRLIVAVIRQRRVAEIGCNPVGADLARRPAIAGLEGAVEIGEVVEAGRRGNVADLAPALARLAQQAVGLAQPLLKHEACERGATALEQELDVAGAEAMALGQPVETEL